MRLLSTISFLALSISTSLIADPCRTIDEGVKIELPEELNQLADVCTIKGNLGIYISSGATQVILPRLESVGMIMVESNDLEAFAAPMLKTAEATYFQGPNLKIIELPMLQQIDRTFYARGPKIEKINIMKLGKAKSFALENVPSLDFIFAESLYALEIAQIHGAPKLDVSAKTAIAMAAGQDTIKDANDTAERLLDLQLKLHQTQRLLATNAYKPSDLPPTGHDVTFGSIGFYYSVYPRYFANYWNTLTSYNMAYYYRPGPTGPFWWWW
jgi:hypothetical protein